MRALAASWILAFFCVFLELISVVSACDGICYDTNAGLGPNNASEFKCVSAVTHCYDNNQACGGSWTVSTTGISSGVWGWNSSGNGSSDNLNLFAYIGAYPLGLPPPDLSTIPGTINFLLLAFLATDTIIGTVPGSPGEILYSTVSGNFVDPIWGTEGILTPEGIQANLLEFPGRQILLSFGGDGLMWYDPENVTLWINNAFTSLTPILMKYSATGLDVNIEHFGTSRTFVQCIGGLAKMFNAVNPNFVLTISPYYTTWGNFKPLYNAYSSYIYMVLYQFYASESANVTVNAQLWNNMIPQVNPNQLAFGFCYNWGLPTQAIGSLLPKLKNFNFNFMMWSVEDDFATNYLMTTAIASNCGSTS